MVTVVHTGVDFITITWSLPLGEQGVQIQHVYINASYMGPCPPVDLEVELQSRQEVLIMPPDATYTLRELLPFSEYELNVTLETTDNAAGTAFPFPVASTTGMGRLSLI